MEEEYLLNKMIKGKTEKEREIELMQNIIETKEKLQNARKNFEYAEDGMIDYYIYQIKANQSKLDYLIKLAKKKGIIVDIISDAKFCLATFSSLFVFNILIINSSSFSISVFSIILFSFKNSSCIFTSHLFFLLYVKFF